MSFSSSSEDDDARFHSAWESEMTENVNRCLGSEISNLKQWMEETFEGRREIYQMKVSMDAIEEAILKLVERSEEQHSEEIASIRDNFTKQLAAEQSGHDNELKKMVEIMTDCHVAELKRLKEAHRDEVREWVRECETLTAALVDQKAGQLSGKAEQSSTKAEELDEMAEKLSGVGVNNSTNAAIAHDFGLELPTDNGPMFKEFVKACVALDSKEQLDGESFPTLERVVAQETELSILEDCEKTVIAPHSEHQTLNDNGNGRVARVANLLSKELGVKVSTKSKEGKHSTEIGRGIIGIFKNFTTGIFNVVVAKDDSKIVDFEIIPGQKIKHEDDAVKRISIKCLAKIGDESLYSLKSIRIHFKTAEDCCSFEKAFKECREERRRVDGNFCGKENVLREQPVTSIIQNDDFSEEKGKEGTNVTKLHETLRVTPKIESVEEPVSLNYEELDSVNDDERASSDSEDEEELWDCLSCLTSNPLKDKICRVCESSMDQKVEMNHVTPNPHFTAPSQGIIGTGTRKLFGSNITVEDLVIKKPTFGDFNRLYPGSANAAKSFGNEESNTASTPVNILQTNGSFGFEIPSTGGYSASTISPVNGSLINVIRPPVFPNTTVPEITKSSSINLDHSNANDDDFLCESTFNPLAAKIVWGLKGKIYRMSKEIVNGEEKKIWATLGSGGIYVYEPAQRDSRPHVVYSNDNKSVVDIALTSSHIANIPPKKPTMLIVVGNAKGFSSKEESYQTIAFRFESADEATSMLETIRPYIKT
uniref:RanBP2-type domain-containing protein n=1 Tax=Rhabditophanes sp. KR3021 TaxID=114890 RepID=A0AC35TP53_9BILA